MAAAGVAAAAAISFGRGSLVSCCLPPNAPLGMKSILMTKYLTYVKL